MGAELISYLTRDSIPVSIRWFQAAPPSSGGGGGGNVSDFKLICPGVGAHQVRLISALRDETSRAWRPDRKRRSGFLRRVPTSVTHQSRGGARGPERPECARPAAACVWTQMV